jgi:DNA-binding transcriptional LysR family regulator
MQTIDDVHVRRLDGTLLLVFEGVLQHRNLTAAAKRLGMTQSAASHALARLRDITGDPLFVRQGAGVAPTSRALALAAPVGRALAALREAVAGGRRFDPSTAERTFTIAALDYLFTGSGPELLRRLQRDAPGCRLIFRTLGRDLGFAALADGTCDLLVGALDAPSPDFERRAVLSDRFAIVARHDHPKLDGGLDLATWLELDHVLVSASGHLTGQVDEALAGIGRRRRVVMSLPQFLAALSAVAGSDAVAAVPTKIATRYAEAFGLRVHAPPIDMPRFEIAVLRHRATLSDLAIDWIEARVTSALVGDE